LSVTRRVVAMTLLGAGRDTPAYDGGRQAVGGGMRQLARALERR
jgi:hypothetical protein